MSYHIYTTDGIILKRSTFGEANTLLYILTEDMGLIFASARSVRLSASKLRGALQEYAYVSVSCVKGKNGWKVTNVIEKRNFYFDSPLCAQKVLAQISSVLLQMIQGETPHPEIFHTVLAGFDFMQEVSDEEISSFEILVVLRVLYQLGYVVKDSTTLMYVADTLEWNNSILKKVGESRELLVARINKALNESHL